MTIAWLHVLANLPHAWHVTTWHHGWYAWREWNFAAHDGRVVQRYSIVEAFGKDHGVTCGYLRMFGRWF